MPADPVVIGVGADGLLSLKSGDSLVPGTLHSALDGLRRELKNQIQKTNTNRSDRTCASSCS